MSGRSHIQTPVKISTTQGICRTPATRQIWQIWQVSLRGINFIHIMDWTFQVKICGNLRNGRFTNQEVKTIQSWKYPSFENFSIFRPCWWVPVRRVWKQKIWFGNDKKLSPELFQQHCSRHTGRSSSHNCSCGAVNSLNAVVFINAWNIICCFCVKGPKDRTDYNLKSFLSKRIFISIDPELVCQY